MDTVEKAMPALEGSKRPCRSFAALFSILLKHSSEGVEVRVNITTHIVLYSLMAAIPKYN